MAENLINEKDKAISITKKSFTVSVSLKHGATVTVNMKNYLPDIYSELTINNFAAGPNYFQATVLGGNYTKGGIRVQATSYNPSTGLLSITGSMGFDTEGVYTEIYVHCFYLA